MRLGSAPIGGAYFADILPSLILLGVGAGLSFVSITTAALARVGQGAAGLASGLLGASVQIGGALGIGILVSVLTTRSRGSWDVLERATQNPVEHQPEPARRGRRG